MEREKNCSTNEFFNRELMTSHINTYIHDMREALDIRAGALAYNFISFLIAVNSKKSNDEYYHKRKFSLNFY